ncbi:MAG: bacteriohemerythrin [Deltaproteobacteria bacterium]|nr:bacteriohemerythrin [Deltaproteobacteria bacterium]
MGILEWNESFSVGIRKIDYQHRKLISLLNELVSASATGQQREVIGRVLEEVVAYTDYHFKAEEDFFRVHPRYEAHHAIHQGFVEQALALLDAYQRNEEDLTSETILYLQNWVKEHILETDVVFFRELGFVDPQNEVVVNKIMATEDDRAKIVLAEDMDDQRLLLKLILEKEGYEVLEARNGAEALALCQADSEIRLMVTDLKMPVMDGYELIRMIRKKQFRYIYIIVVSSLADKGDIVKALSCGANDFLTKPVFPEELRLRIQGGRQLLKLETQDELIMSLARLADSRSHETGMHLERTQAFSHILGLYLREKHPEMKITDLMVKEIAQVTPLHDIGKVGIPDNILGKPGRLTEEEFEIMKEHSTIGGNLLSDIYIKTGSQTMRIAFEVAMYHHERWDGGGYPAGLVGNSIPIAARIMAVADVYDALTSERVYKKAFSHEKSRKIMVEGRGTHFDPRLIDAFLALEDRFIEVREQMRD